MEQTDLTFGKQQRFLLTTGSIIALAAGLCGGIAVHAFGNPALRALPDLVEPLGTIWVNALQMTVVPLIITQLVVAITATGNARTAGKLSGGAMLLFVVFLALSGLFALGLGQAIIQRVSVDRTAVTAMSQEMAGTVRQLAESVPASPSPGAWLPSVVPKNPFKAAADGELLQILVFTGLFAFALVRTGGEKSLVVVRLFQGLAAVIFTMIVWILLFTPLAVFALAFAFSARAGVSAATVLVQFLVISCGVLLAFTILLYPFSMLTGRIGLRTFALGVLPAQIVAVTTRSSIASLPALLAGAEGRMKMNPTISRLALPLSVSVFKVNRPISSTIKLLFVAHLFGIPLTPAQLATFLFTVMILSFVAVGLPRSTGTFYTLPAFVAAGLPAEGIILLEPVEVIIDVFKTLVNVTNDMSVAVILARFAGQHAAEEQGDSLQEALSAAAIQPAIDSQAGS